MPATRLATDKGDDQTRLPYMARWIERVTNPVGSTSMQNPDTSTYNKSTEDNDT